MKNFLTVAALAVATLMALPAHANTIFMGTLGGNDSLAEVNTLITSYNAEHSTTFQSLDFKLARWNCAELGGVDCAGWDTEDGEVSAGLFDVQLSPDLKSGTFTYAGAPGVLLGAFVVKGGNNFALYYLDPALSSVAAPGIAFDTYELWVGKKGQEKNPAVSHITWYGFEGDLPCQGDECDPGDVPEPATLVLLGLGLLGAGYARRRRQ